MCRGVDDAAVLSDLVDIFNIERSERKIMKWCEVKAPGQHVSASAVPAGTPAM